MKCLNCGHEANQHNLAGDRVCRVRVLSDWCEMEETYTGFRPCGCQCYRGSECPHEFVTTSENCVHCGNARQQAR